MTGAAALVLPDSGYQYPDSGVGFDTIAIAGPTSQSTLYELDAVWRGEEPNRETGELKALPPWGRTFIELGMASASVRINGLPNGDLAQMRIEVSAPRMLHGHNWDGLDVSLLPDVVDHMLTGIAEHFVDVPTMDQIRIHRLDLTRDFLGVRNPPATLAAIAEHSVPHATVNERYFRPSGELQTYVRGAGRYWRVRGYDKVYEQASRGQSPSERTSQLRFETELKSKWLTSRGIYTLRDVAGRDLRGVTRSFFERCRYDVNTAATSASEIFERMKTDGVTDSAIKNVQAYLFAKQHNCAPMMSKNPAAAARALVNRYRLTPSTLGTEAFERRLDFESGTEICE